MTLTIRYSYGAPSVHARNVLRVEPLRLEGLQRRLTANVDIDPTPDDRIERIDFFGNAVTEIGYRGPVEGLTVSLTSRVERLPGPERLDLSPTMEQLAAERSALVEMGGGSPHHFVTATERTRAVPEIAAFAKSASEGSSTVLQTVASLGKAIHEVMVFNPGATDVDTFAGEAFEERYGVCQDFSHIMIIGLRALGIPAAYVSGFLRTVAPPGQPRLMGTDAMHAWVRAWCGAQMGWVGYDPTNDLWVGEDHIAVAFGRDYRDVAPIKGALRSTGKQESRHSVDVMPIAAASGS
ncbi:MAG: transglutaminase family protein [Myxococcota bacterium]